MQDLRQDENTFAQMVVHKLFYSVRRVVDEAGRALPSGARIEGVLYAEDRYDRADTLGLSNIPIYVQLSGAGEEGSAGVIVNATARDQWDTSGWVATAPEAARRSAPTAHARRRHVSARAACGCVIH